jgi:Ca2+-transporting ATPase
VPAVAFVQERRSEESLEALAKLVPHHCQIVRSGAPVSALANALVPGDLVTFSTGDRVPADVRLCAAQGLELDESSLTGETRARRKGAAACAPGLALAERTCVAYMGTLVRAGRGQGVVVATGKATEFGAIFSMMEEVEEKRTPLQLRMDELAQQLSMLSFGIIGVICLIGVLQSRSWLEMFTIGGSARILRPRRALMPSQCH